MATPAEIRRERAQQMKESAVRQRSATKSPMQSSGGHGFEHGYAKPDPTFDNPSAHGATAPLPPGGMGGLAEATPKTTRRSFGVSEGDQ